MARVKKQRLKKRADGRFRCRYQNKDFYGKTEEEALAARNEYIYRVESGQLAHESRTVSEYAKKWLPLEKANVREKAYNMAATLLEYMTMEVGYKELSEVLPSDIKTVYAKHLSGLSDGYIRRARQLYISLFDSAVADGLCSRNPADDKTAKPPKGKKGSHRSITEQERKWILTYCRDHRAFPAVMAMLYAGLRPPEAKALDIDRDVDKEGEIIHVSHFTHIVKNQYTFDEEGKTEKSVRDIPLFPPLAEVLKDKHGKLISCIDGSEITISGWRRLYESYVLKMEKAINGMSKQKFMKEKRSSPWISFTVKPYDLRHSFCSMCRDYEIELNTVVQWMGHADATMILKIYDSVSSKRDEEQTDKLKKILLSGQSGGQNSEAVSEGLKNKECKD